MEVGPGCGEGRGLKDPGSGEEGVRAPNWGALGGGAGTSLTCIVRS